MEIRGLEEAWKEGLYVFVGGKWRWLFSYRGEESILVFGRVFKHFFLKIFEIFLIILSA